MDTSSARRIVVGFDGSHSSIAALHWAAIEAKSTGSTLDLVMTWEWPINCGWPQALVDSYNQKPSPLKSWNRPNKECERCTEMSTFVLALSTANLHRPLSKRHGAPHSW